MVLEWSLKRFADETLKSDYFVGSGQFLFNLSRCFRSLKDSFEFTLCFQQILEELRVNDQKAREFYHRHSKYCCLAIPAI